ncbi:hypothetical protein ACGFXC_27280 [Streptomyces sp. NPDC048507]|uniref:hypothetical protein n=1 Tax=Streptomyces sp. NPDC048507 TaxID=3365560 RepID=UPI00371831D3
MTRNSSPGKRPAAAAALVPFLVLAGLLLGPTATASATTSAPAAVRQAPATAALAHDALAAGSGVASGLRAPTSAQARAVTGIKKGKKSKKKKSGFLGKLVLIVLVVLVLIVVLYLVRRTLRRRSS